LQDGSVPIACPFASSAHYLTCHVPWSRLNKVPQTLRDLQQWLPVAGLSFSRPKLFYCDSGCPDQVSLFFFFFVFFFLRVLYLFDNLR
jgi:hypothetical protein